MEFTLIGGNYCFVWPLRPAVWDTFMPLSSIPNIDDGKITMTIKFGPMYVTRCNDGRLAKDPLIGPIHRNELLAALGTRHNEKRNPCYIKSKTE